MNEEIKKAKKVIKGVNEAEQKLREIEETESKKKKIEDSLKKALIPFNKSMVELISMLKTVDEDVVKIESRSFSIQVPHESIFKEIFNAYYYRHNIKKILEVHDNLLKIAKIIEANPFVAIELKRRNK